jgi:hypothetical protein
VKDFVFRDDVWRMQAADFPQYLSEEKKSRQKSSPKSELQKNEDGVLRQRRVRQNPAGAKH